MSSTVAALTKSPADYVEAVRVSWERRFEAEIPSQVEQEPVRPEPTLLSEAAAPRLHALKREVARVLRWDEPVDLYRLNEVEKRPNAQALLSRRPSGIRFIGPVAHLLNDGGLRAMIGHEFGHILAHGPQAFPPSRILEVTHGDRVSELGRRCCLAAELTADRFALLAAQDLAAAVHLELASAFGDSPVAMGTRAIEYLHECNQQVDQSRVALVEKRWGYPTPPFRLFATWLFYTSDVYKSLTGTGSGENCLRDVDDLLMALGLKALRSMPVPVHLASESPPTEPFEHSQPVSSPPRVVERTQDVARRALAGSRVLAQSLASFAINQLRDTSSSNPSGLTRGSGTEHAGDDSADASPELAELERRFRELEDKERGRT